MALVPGVVDIPFTPLNQVPSDTMGPLGRLQHLVDAQITKYEPHYQGTTGVVPAKVKVEPRDPFVSLSSVARSVVNGDISAPPVSPPQLLSPLQAQLVAIAKSQARVWGGDHFSSYPDARIVTRKLTQDVLHTSQHTIQAPDSAWMDGVTCAVWTETVNVSAGPVTSAYVGFQADSGAWLVTPSVIGSSGGLQRATLAKVVTDGSVFWVVFNDDQTTPGLIIQAYDRNGMFLADTALTPIPDGSNYPGGSKYPGYWDIIAAPSPGGFTMQIAVPVATGNGVDSGVTFTSYGWNGTAIIHATSADSTLHCSGPLSWITNDQGNGLAYLATARSFNDDQCDIWAYEVTNRAKTHEYGTGIAIRSSFSIDSVAGNTFTDGSGVGVVLSIGQLARDVSITVNGGTAHDPALRSISSTQITRGGTVTTLRTTQSVCQVSRAFQIDGEYYVYAYYQSGSGLQITPKTLPVTPTTGDFMIGAPVQPLAVVAGDEVFGSPINQIVPAPGGGAFAILKTGSVGSTSMPASSSAAIYTSSGLAGIPDGTQLMRWTLPGLVVPTGGLASSRLVIAGTSTGQNGTFDIIADATDSFRLSGGQLLTPMQDINGNTISPASSVLGGTYAVTAMVGYFVNDLSAQITTAATAALFAGGTITISASGGSGNNGTFAIARIRSPLAGYPSPAGSNPSFRDTAGAGFSIVWAVATTQTTNTSGFTAVISPSAPNAWSFTNGQFDFTYDGADIVVTANPVLPANVGTFPITSVTSPTEVVTGGATALLPQIFGYPFPTVQIQLTTQVPYTFKFASVTPDYTYQGAIVSVQGADPVNNGNYQIIQINPDGSFIATPTSGLNNQVNEAFGPSQTVTIFFNSNIQPEFQPTWFLVPLTGSQPVVGRFEYGLAYADWRIEGDSTLPANLYPMALTTPAITSNGLQVTLPYRAQNVTSSVVQITAAGDVDIGEQSFSSTVGLKRFWLEVASGQAYQNSGELLIPGPMASVFTSSGFHEDNFNIAMEAPFLVSQSVAGGGQLCLTQNATYIYVAQLEGTDENGNRIYSPPSPPLQVTMAGTNNVATLGGRLPYPIDSSGNPVANTYGLTTRLGTLCLYRTAFINGVPTTQRYKITLDLNPNGLAPVSTTNPSGFSFPDTFTWNYIDQNPDSSLSANEILLTDKGYLPRFPAPAFSNGVGSWKNREWLIGYDSAIWMSGEKTEGDAIWFNPAFRFILPTDDEPLALAPVEDYLIVFCARSVWYIPATTFPDATGSNGTLPTPVQLPFPNGSLNGFACPIRDGAAYDSTAGGLWMVTRNLENVWLGEPVKDTLTGVITGLTLDARQRLVVQQAGSRIACVYDRVPQAWYEWNLPTQGLLLATFNGEAVYQDSTNINICTPTAATDLVNGVTSGIAMDVTLAPLNIGNVRGLKRVWEFQGVGEYKGPHRINVTLDYPEDDQPETTYKPFTPVAGKPYIIPFNPMQETASQFLIRFFVDFVGVNSPGESCTLEMVSAQVGMEPVGIAKRPSFVTLTANR